MYAALRCHTSGTPPRGWHTIAIGVVVAFVLAPPSAYGDGDDVSFALIIGVNRAPDGDLPPLRYADDDAARYRDLFQTLGAHTTLLATLDEDTRRLHPDAAKEARVPRWAELQAAVDQIAAEVKSARRGGTSVSLYVLYAGHGGDDGRAGYITLEDRHLTGPDLITHVFDRVEANRKHLIVDACSAYMLAIGRGRGGQRRPLHGFAQMGQALLERADIGLLLSTSSARESHEWAAFQAGIFSHELRSGLFGAADTNGDGVVDYAEMGLFIARANQSVPNERFRPDVYFRAPSSGGALFNLRAALARRRLEVPGREGDHYFLEDSQGVRLADFHNGKSFTVRLVRPPSPHPLFLQRISDGREYELPASVTIVEDSSISTQTSHTATRGAAHEAFSALFALPLERSTDAQGRSQMAASSLGTNGGSPWSPRKKLGWGLLSLAGVTAVLSAESFLWAQSLESIGSPGHGSFEKKLGIVSAALSGVAGVTGASVLLWPGVTPGSDGLALGWVGRF